LKKRFYAELEGARESMGERALGWGLRLLEVALLVGPILVAFAAHGWDFRAVVMLSPNPMEKLRLETPQVGQVGTPTKVGEYVWEVTASFTSPFDFAFSIEDYSGEIFCVQGGDNIKVGSLRLKEKVRFQPRASENLTIVMEFTPTGRTHLEGHGWGASVEIEFRDVAMKVEIFGIFVIPPPLTQRTSIRVS